METQENLEWNMGVWLEYWDAEESVIVDVFDTVESLAFNLQDAEQCEMCMAGAVMLQHRHPYGRWAGAIDSMRCGHFVDAYKQVHAIGFYEQLQGSALSTLRDKLKEVDALYWDLQRSNEDLYGRRIGHPPPSNTLTWDQFDKVVEALRERDL